MMNLWNLLWIIPLSMLAGLGIVMLSVAGQHKQDIEDEDEK